MSQQFWVNNYLIDIKRNQISHQQQQTPIAPKALAVLAVLAEHAGEVVSHDTLMDAVWPDTIVTPNTLQRCIAQLRKAFGDDSKHQAFIKTHAKQGYSLEAAVCWDDPTPSVQQSVVAEKAPSDDSPAKAENKLWLVLPMLLLVLVVAWWQFNKSPRHQFSHVVPLTASDERETNARYSPDGKYLVFHRFQATCEHHIWAKDLTTQQEFRLTKEPGIYGSHSWSQDGSQLTFSERGNCQLPVQNAQPEKICWRINTLDFSSALSEPQSVVTRLDCDTQRNAVARFLPNGKIAMLREVEPYLNKLTVLDPRDNKLHDVYRDDERYIYSYDYSFKTNLIALTSRDVDSNHYIDVISLDGKRLSSHPIALRRQDASYEFYNVYFHPDGKSLLTDTALGLFDLSFDGQLSPINTMGHNDVFDANYHPSGQRIVASQMSSDKDIVAVTWDDIKSGKPSVIARSTSVELSAKRQPNGEAVAFISKRSGTHQLWISSNNQVTQLTAFDTGIARDSLIWAANGERIAVLHQQKIVMVDLSGKVLQIDSVLPIMQLMSWPTTSKFIVLAEQSHQARLYEFDINKPDSLKLLSSEATISAVSTDAKQIVSVLENGDVWLIGSEQRQLSALNNQVFRQNLHYYDNQLWGLNQQRQLWRYDLATEQLHYVKQLGDDISALTDVNESGVLLNQVISVKKELIEFQ
ncbi:winged helix-turn-helix domain-containing protein [Psychrobium sp. MM17-31]|uniref:winged helix-turn-helix domain-containing protein n=1 Tax=Psychrobium sp. MM17-31 TaxID=2917758 RepID=UPI001EF60A55|nr:winged helix-turn-helix domain-containing protein [Psychrobium sp. MM17-31]MCG7532562.1 winged helix-turn-helix domain-containing protein [Psychrobium sp. MM17-31]